MSKCITSSLFPELAVERSGRVVSIIRLDIDDPTALFFCDFAQPRYERRRDALPSVCVRDSKIIDVEFGSLLFEFRKFVTSKRAHNVFVLKRNQSDECRIGEQPRPVVCGGTFSGIALKIVEGGSKDIEHACEQAVVFGLQSLNCGHRVLYLSPLR